MVKTMARLLAAALALGGAPGLAQESTQAEAERIIRALDPGVQRVRSYRGVEVVEPVAPNPERQTVDLTVAFDFASADLNVDGRQALQPLGLALADDRLKGLRFRIAGHTDAVGPEQANQVLSWRRALAVRDFIVLHYGVLEERLEVVGYGESKLLLPNDPEAGANRRVQVSTIGRAD